MYVRLAVDSEEINGWKLQQLNMADNILQVLLIYSFFSPQSRPKLKQFQRIYDFLILTLWYNHFAALWISPPLSRSTWKNLCTCTSVNFQFQGQILCENLCSVYFDITGNLDMLERTVSKHVVVTCSGSVSVAFPRSYTTGGDGTDRKNRKQWPPCTLHSILLTWQSKKQSGK